MHKNPGKDLHMNVRVRRGGGNRVQTGGEIQEMQARLEALLQAADRKSIQVAELMQMKASEVSHLKEQVGRAFKKNSEQQVQKVLIKANMELENHLHHVERELGIKKMEIKKIRADVQALKVVLRKNLQKGPRSVYPGK